MTNDQQNKKLGETPPNQWGRPDREWDEEGKMKERERADRIQPRKRHMTNLGSSEQK